MHTKRFVPTSVERTPQSLRSYLSADQYRLYDLIWKRFVASQMNPAILDVTTIDISAGGISVPCNRINSQV